MLMPRSAQWLRDTGNQFAHLYKLLPQDDNLAALVKAVINTESRYIYQYPYCGMASRIRADAARAKLCRIVSAPARVGAEAYRERLRHQGQCQSVCCA
jgi:hypothetical protein